MNCGCKIISSWSRGNPYIEYCPLHLSAEKLRDALEHISEYWNRRENDTAMSDALYHMIETADTALAASRGVKP